MAGVRVEMESGWEAALTSATSDGLSTLFKGDLGPAILQDMQAGTPVLTGRLVASEDFEVVHEGPLPELHIGSYPDAEGDVDYAAATELGFDGPEEVRAHTRNGHPVAAHIRTGHTPEQPYMRPALFRERSA